MRWQGNSLASPVSTRGIIDLELAKEQWRYLQLMAVWDLKDVKLNIYLDFIFVAAYTWFLYSASRKLSVTAGWKKTGTFFSVVSILAGVLDIIENIGMLKLLQAWDSTISMVVYYAAMIKFILIGMVLLFLLVAFVFSLTHRKRPLQV